MSRPQVLAALRRRAGREETAIAEERAALDEATADLADRQARLCALWAPLAVFEELPADDPPLAGATQALALRLRAGRDQLARREQERARLDDALARAGRDD